MSNPIVIIGSGLAGYSLAKEFRKLDQNQSLVMITQDNGDYYSKPMLSNAFAKSKTAEQLAMSSAESMSEQLQMTVRASTTVTAIDPANQQIHIGDEVLQYEKLVLARGAHVFQPNLQGDAVDQIISVNSLQDYAKFREAITDKKKLLIMGGGLIGCEFANDLTHAGFEVTVVDVLDTPLQQLLPREVGLNLQQALANIGVTWQLGSKAVAVNHQDDGYVVEFDNGSKIATDLVLSAIGLRPSKHLAQEAGLATNAGIVVDRYLQTSDANIFSLGDCAEVEGHLLRYTMPLFACAKALAKTLAGERTAVSYPAMPVTIKTSDFPLVVLSPDRKIEGQWQFSDDGNTALFYDAQNTLRGFVLAREATKQRMQYTKQVPDLF